MTSLEAYQSLLEKVNRNDTNSNINISRGKFVNTYNQQRIVWLADRLKAAKASQELDTLSELLEDDVPLKFIENKRDHARFTLPTDFFEFSSSYSLATKGDCSNRVLTNWEMKSSDKRVLLTDDNNKPSFEYEETLLLISTGKANVYFTDFTIDEVFLTYYKEPAKIDLAGYIKVDGTPSQTIDPDLPDDLVEEIINYCSTELMRKTENAEGINISKDRIKQ